MKRIKEWFKRHEDQLFCTTAILALLVWFLNALFAVLRYYGVKI